MIIDRQTGAIHVLDMLAIAFTAQEGYFNIHDLLTPGQLLYVKDRAHQVAEQLYDTHMVHGSLEQAKHYLGAEIATGSRDAALTFLYNRTMAGELIEACMHVLMNRIEGAVVRQNMHDDDVRQNFYDHELDLFGHTYRLESKRLPWLANGNIAWNAKRKIETAYIHCNPKLPLDQHIDFMLIAKCHPNLGIFAPTAIIRNESFFNYTSPSDFKGVLYKHLKDKTRRANDHRFVNEMFFGTSGTGGVNDLCKQLLDGYKLNPSAYNKLLTDEAALEEDDEASDFIKTETLTV